MATSKEIQTMRSSLSIYREAFTTQLMNCGFSATEPYPAHMNCEKFTKTDCTVFLYKREVNVLFHGVMDLVSLRCEYYDAFLALTGNMTPDTEPALMLLYAEGQK
jgi:hypothetical protein